MNQTATINSRYDQYNKERFMSFLEPNFNTGCIEWTGGLDKDGYGCFTYTVWTNTKKSIRAHRYAFLICAGFLPTLDILHKCDNAKCCNPNHFFLGTNVDNMKDRHRKGRYAVGEDHPTCRLTNVQIMEIYASTLRNAELAKKHGVGKHVIQTIKSGKTAKGVTKHVSTSNNT